MTLGATQAAESLGKTLFDRALLVFLNLFFVFSIELLFLLQK